MSFQYTTGDPDNLVGGTAANMLDIQGPFVDLKAFLNQRIAAIPTLVTNLPVGPVDGQEVYYLADSTNGVVWHLRYRSASGSAYKWEFVGGPPIWSEALADSNAGLASGAWATISAGDPSVTLPLAGDYIATSTLRMSTATAASSVFHGLQVNAVDPSVASNAVYSYVAVANTWESLTIRHKVTLAAAGQVVKQRYQHNSGAAATISRGAARLDLIPIRVG